MAVLRNGAAAGEQTPLFPSWHTLLRRAAERLRGEQLASAANHLEAKLAHAPVDYYECAELAQQELGDQRWRDLLVELFDPQFGVADPGSLTLARLVWGIGSRLVITTNFDRVLQWTCPKVQDLRRIVIQESHALQRVLRAHGDPDRPAVWHLHGHIEEPSRLVLAPDGYRLLYGKGDNERSAYTAALKSLSTIALTKTLLFIGFSFGDRVFVNALAQAHSEFNGSGGPHFVIAQESDRAGFEALLRENRLSHIAQVVSYAHHGEPLLNLLRHLANGVNGGEVDASVDAGEGVGAEADTQGQAAAPRPSQPSEGMRRGVQLGGLAGEYLSSGTRGANERDTSVAPVVPILAVAPRKAVRVQEPQPVVEPNDIAERVGPALFDDLGALFAAHAEEVVGPIARITGMSEEVVLHHLNREPGRRVQEIFRAVWPSDEALGDYTVAQIRRWQLTGAVARFVGRPYGEIEARLADEFGQTKVRTVFTERWQRANEADAPEGRLDVFSPMEDIETVTVAYARKHDLADVISEITQRSRAWVNQRFQEMHGKTFVMRAFQDRWPDNDYLGSYTAAACLRLGLVARIARTIDRTPAYVTRRLKATPGQTKVCTLFGNEWPIE